MKAQARILASILALAALALPGASASHAQPVACVGDEGPELPGVCYDPDDGDSCDVYVGLGGGNQYCAVGSTNTCSSQAPEWPGHCWAPREPCQLWVSAGGGTMFCLLPVSASTSAPSACVGDQPEFPGACLTPGADCTATVGVGTGQSLCVELTAPQGHGDSDSTCYLVLRGPNGPEGLCYDTSRDTCQVWYNRGSGGFHEECLT